MKTQRNTTTRAFALPSPRPKPRLYKYLFDEEPSLDTIIFDLIDGLSITEVEPDLYNSLLPLLREKERALKEWRNQPASRSIAEAIEYISNYRYENDPKQLQTRSFRRSIRGTISDQSTKLIMTPAELAISVDSALRGEFKRIDPRAYRTLILELKKIHKDALNNHDYLLAEQAVNASRKVIALTSDNKFAEITSAKVFELSEKLAIKENDVENLREKWERSIFEAERSKIEDLKEIEKLNEQELIEFDKQYDLPPPPDLRKISPNILQLRAQEKYMVTAGMYSQATELSHEVDQLEKAEKEVQQERWIDFLNHKREEVIKKQKEKLFVREMNANNVIEKMKRQAQSEIEKQEKAVKHVEAHFESAAAIQSLGNTKITKSPRNSNYNNNNSNNMNRNNHGANGKSSKSVEQSPAALFRQRAMINTIVYTKTGKSPRAMKPV
ncbi:hypothetical protein TRFO_23697 [Tritrichomonas foetus]|uniref:Uncharacterized protein n=1 Tax=Tritrichomonas foetus TaxID=1144522 RepID=A0A1J4KF35_9EUKA|nr:hypothetical protein TRFO_23697 [Tritrichomonas foetus]|eukprot:OHT07989.1 hypothetical protein TRFO_23697 [Tritrichomonas foetus]